MIMENMVVKMCVDIRKANETIICDNHTILTIEETRKEMGEGKYFSKTDFNLTYHQIEPTSFAASDTLYRLIKKKKKISADQNRLPSSS